MTTPLPGTVSAFLRDHIGSIEQLEVLLLLRSESGRLWQAAELSAALRTTPASVALRLDGLERSGLVSRAADRFRFDPGPLAATVDEVASCYPTHRRAVIETVFSADVH